MSRRRCCCSQPEPGETCLPCTDSTSFFDGCYSPTTLPLAPAVAGCDHIAHADEATAWDKPQVIVSASWLYRRLLPNPMVLQEFGDSCEMTVCRHEACGVFDAYCNFDYGGSDRWSLQVVHAGRSPTGVCSQVPSNDEYNFSFDLLKITPGTPGFKAFAATRDASPCYGTGFLLPYGGTGHIIEDTAVFSGSCAAKTVAWSGAKTYTSGASTYREEMSVQVQINGFADCPEVLGI